MIITFKTLLQQTFTVDVDDTLTIKDLKRKVNEERGSDFPAESLNLIYSGAIMKDEEQIKDYKIDSKKFIVVMKKKEKVEAVASSSPATPATATSTTTTSSKPTAQPSTAQTTTSADVSPTSVTPQPTSGTSSAGDNEGVVRNMMELGYSRSLVEAALRLSYNNPDVACEYLISERITEANVDSVEADNLALGGVRDELMELADAYDNSQNQAQNPENEPLAFLRAQPQFHQMRQQIQENPQFLNTVLQQIGVNNPGLLKLISENQRAFVNMINEPLNNNNNNNMAQNNRNTCPAPGEEIASAPAAEQSAPSDLLAATNQMQEVNEDDEEQGDERAQHTAGVDLPELTESDRAAIGRIREISGFSEIEVVQAYIACGRSEELALNFLFND